MNVVVSSTLKVQQGAMTAVLPRTLSREEEAELALSNKKVKDYHHADFNVGTREEFGTHRDPGSNV